MKLEIMSTQDAPKAIGPYSQAVKCGGFLFCSGQIPLDPATGGIVPGGIAEQTEQVITNIKAVLAAAGVDITKVVKTTCFLASMDDFAAFNEVYARHFTAKLARSCVAVAGIPKGALVEIEVIAVVD